MKIKRLIVGQLQTNCYLVWDKMTKKAVIIDPGDDGGYIASQIEELGLKPKLILATHGHFDHVLAVSELKLNLKIPFFLHRADLPLVKKTSRSARFWLGLTSELTPEVDGYVKEGDLVEFGKQKLQVIETPGHSPGGVVLYSKKFASLFSGDTLFKQGVGRTDLTYSSPSDLQGSLKKLFKLPDDTIVYSGHGQETTIGKERRLLNRSAKKYRPFF